MTKIKKVFNNNTGQRIYIVRLSKNVLIISKCSINALINYKGMFLRKIISFSEILSKAFYG